MKIHFHVGNKFRSTLCLGMCSIGGNIGPRQAQRTIGHCHSYGPPCHPGVPHKHLCEDETPQNHSVELEVKENLG